MIKKKTQKSQITPENVSKSLNKPCEFGRKWGWGENGKRTTEIKATHCR